MRVVDWLVRGFDCVARIAQGAVFVRLEELRFLVTEFLLINFDSGCLSPVGDLKILTASGTCGSWCVISMLGNLTSCSTRRLLAVMVAGVRTVGVSSVLFRLDIVRVAGRLALFDNVVGVSCRIFGALLADLGYIVGMCSRSFGCFPCRGGTCVRLVGLSTSSPRRTGASLSSSSIW